jgi:hypothetical protein
MEKDYGCMQINNAQRSPSPSGRAVEKKDRVIIRKNPQFVEIGRKDEYANVKEILHRVPFFGLESGFLKKFRLGNFPIRGENLFTRGRNTLKKIEVRR